MHVCLEYLLESAHWGGGSLRQQIYFYYNIFANKCCRCNEGPLYNHYENMPI